MLTPARHRLVGILLAYAAMAMCAGAAEPAKVSPSTDTFAGLRARTSQPASSFGERLDAGHDWIYRGLRRWLEGLDTRFAGGDGAPILVPLSPLRLGVNSEYLHRQKGSTISLRPDLEADLHLPNLEHRFRLFVSSTDLPESPGDPAAERNPVRAGVRFARLSYAGFDFGVRVKVRPTVIAALKWSSDFTAGSAHGYPFAKAYVESGLGLGVSAGVSLERSLGYWILRSATYANWLRNTAATDWSQTLLVGYGRAVIQERRYDRPASGMTLPAVRPDA